MQKMYFKLNFVGGTPALYSSVIDYWLKWTIFFFSFFNLPLLPEHQDGMYLDKSGPVKDPLVSAVETTAPPRSIYRLKDVAQCPQVTVWFCFNKQILHN